VPDGVNNGQFGIGMVIDFFGLAGKYSGFPVDFVYPERHGRGAGQHRAGGRRQERRRGQEVHRLHRVAEGQQLLFDPKISRLPILPPEPCLKAPAGYPNPRDRQARQGAVRLRPVGGALQRGVGLFDQTITFRLKDLQAATKAIHEPRRALAKPNAEGR
jgi:phosphoglycerate transport regulatory protein PgtC